MLLFVEHGDSHRVRPGSHDLLLSGSNEKELSSTLYNIWINSTDFRCLPCWYRISLQVADFFIVPLSTICFVNNFVSDSVQTIEIRTI